MRTRIAAPHRKSLIARFISSKTSALPGATRSVRGLHAEQRPYPKRVTPPPALLRNAAKIGMSALRVTRRPLVDHTLRWHLGEHMRNLLAASTLAILSAVLLSACASADSTAAADGTDDANDTSSTSQALALRGTTTTATTTNQVVVDPPPPSPPPTYLPPHGLVTTGGLLAPLCSTPAPTRRFDLRRKTRSCEDLPGAYVVDNTTFIPGNGGHYRVGRLLDGTGAPPVIQAKACIYTWEPDNCAAPDTSKLLLEPDEALTERPAICISNPASCAPTVVPTSPFRVPHVIPNGPGRCEVCGFATNNSLWVVLPDGWTGFQYKLPTDTAPRYVYLDPSTTPAQATTDATVIQVPLDATVVDQDVEVAPAFQ